MFRTTNIEELNLYSKKSLLGHLSIEFIDIGEDFITATMPVITETKQPLGFLHGGATLALAESVGSVASFLLINPEKQSVFGLEINANHIKSKREGMVTAVAKAIHIGSRTHIWDIKIKDEKGMLISIVRLTNMVVDVKKG
jgi:uncharacterized protein (TIGR00369 family)